MTTILAIQNDDSCEIYCDNQTTDGSGRKYNHPKMAKISKRGEYLIAGAGEAFPCDIAQHIWEPPTPTARDFRNLYHFVIAKVVPSLRKCLIENGFVFDVEDTEDYRFCFLIAIGGELFNIEDDLSVGIRKDGIYGIGSGSKYAIGALMAGADPIEALKIAAENDAYTSAPFQKKVQYRHG